MSVFGTGMSVFDSSGYPPNYKQPRGDRHQRAVFKANHQLICNTIEDEPMVNISQIAEKTGLERRIVRKHLEAMLAAGEVAKVGIGYVPAHKASAELKNWVKTILREAILGKNTMTDWTISFARNVAACYLVSDPHKSRGMFIDFFQPRVDEFIESGFWLDEILAHAVGYELVPNIHKVYSQEKDTIDASLLKECCDFFFKDTELLVFAYAISPPQLLRFLKSPRGISWATRILKERWNSIVSEAAKIQGKPESEYRRLVLQSLRSGKKGQSLDVPPGGRPPRGLDR